MSESSPKPPNTGDAAPSAQPAFKDTLFEFPTVYPLKVAGINAVTFEANVVEIIKRHVHDFDPGTISVRESKGGKYLAVSVSFTANSKAQLDALYHDLTAHPDIVWAL